MLNFSSLEEIVAATASGVRPAERISVSQFAEKYRKLNNPGSFVGAWSNEETPYMVEPQDVLTSTAHRALVFVGPARTGKTEGVFNWIGHSAKCDPSDIMVVQMTQASARDWSQGDLRKMFRDTPDVGALVTPGRQNMNVHDVRFLSGMRLLVKWPALTELSGKNIPRVWLADYDRMPLDIEKQGPPFFLARKRTQTYGRYGMTVAESSPGHPVKDANHIPAVPHEAPPAEGIMSLYNEGDRRRFYWRCLECREAFEPDFCHFAYPDTRDFSEAAEKTTLNCPSCGFAHTHDMKAQLNKTGRWLRGGQRWLKNGDIVGDGARSEIASFWLKSPPARFTTWGELVSKYLHAMDTFERTGSEEELCATVNLDQGHPYTPKAISSARLPEMLKDRAEDWGGSAQDPVVPEGVRYLVAAIDVQARAFVVHVFGFGIGGDVWHVDMFKIRKSNRLDDSNERKIIEPATYHEDWRLLVEQVIEKTYPLGDFSGRHMQVKMVCCDSGGLAGATANAYKFYWWLQSEHPARHDARFQLVKGDSRSAPRYQIRTPESNKKGAHPAPVAFLNSNLLKDQISAMLDRDTPGGGMVHFPIWAEDWLYSQLAAEVRTDKGWENPHRRKNEAWDLLYYAVAIGLDIRIGSERIDWEKPNGWAEEWDRNTLVFDGAQAPNFGPARKPKSRADLAKKLA